MTRIKLLAGMAIAASLLSYAPMAEAAPIVASPGAMAVSGSDGLIVKTVTRAGVAHRSTRRTARRVNRR
ncbi:hypothetical protein [uncultured Rhodoblastus sp.]|uniref:hypothetical protein n=1 Tax=uncultured Rhodoblastus sp. TaxID=543037 RepID=UPI0025E9E5FE|nr:hypothetical protein [uncultured Rhodoblastus sp.]